MTERDVRSAKAVDFLSLCGQLKLTKRAGWQRCNVELPESVSDHMYRMAMACMLIDDKRVDRNKCIRMALVHDLGEALIGDITPHDNISKEEKQKAEAEAMDQICRTLSEGTFSLAKQDILELWKEYDNASTLEAVYLKDFDKFEMLIQALEYERSQNIDLSQFYEGVSGKLRTGLVKAWHSELLNRREETLCHQQERRFALLRRPARWLNRDFLLGGLLGLCTGGSLVCALYLFQGRS
eukprot:gb/GECG01008982.1/.p1 GENE.gb/GECG01008982.1/~~gb/GECG01008982.1/.p1  ORF type:complete len:239 (+),score=26.09 gb/GECG01008982.1/:1-717(+)